MEGINIENPTGFDVRLISLKNYYVSLKKRKEIKKLRRLKLLLYMYPKIIMANNFRSIEMIVEDPTDKTVYVTEKKNMTALEYGLARKYSNETFSDRLIFRVSDFYDYFGVGD
jgi:hypothetical protein